MTTNPMPEAGGSHVTPVGEKESLEALLHGIFAITMTLLILELRIPETEDGLGAGLRELGPEIGGYAFGFVYLMSAWLALRNFTRQLSGVTRTVSVLFLLVIGFVSLTPFTVSALIAGLGDSDDLGTAVRLMASVTAAGYLTSAFMGKLALRQGLVPATPFFLTSWPIWIAQTTGPAVLGFLLAFLNPWVGLAVLCLDILLNIIVTEPMPTPAPAS